MTEAARQAGSDKTAVRPFHVDIPEEAIAGLRRRTAAWRPPGREPADDQSQGVQLATVQDLATYWATEYGWRRCEAKLNTLPRFITTIDGLDIHFIHVRSPRQDALPLIVSHGWPGYGLIQGTRPRTIGYSLADTPAGLAAWLLAPGRKRAEGRAVTARRRRHRFLQEVQTGSHGLQATARIARQTSLPGPDARHPPHSAGGRGQFQ